MRRRRILLSGDMPCPLAPLPGRAFATRCRFAVAACRTAVPPLREVAPGHLSACIRDDVALQSPLGAA